MKNLKIVALDATNFRKLKCFFVNFKNKGITLFSGRNAQGKTSALDLIEYAIMGKKVVNGNYITNGENKMTVNCKIDGEDTEIEIHRVQTEKSSVLEVFVDGNKITKPQNFLKELINNFTFDVSRFTTLSAQEKVKFIMDSAGLDFTAINNEINKATSDRRDKGVLKRSYGDCERVDKVEKPQPIDSILSKRRKTEVENNAIHNRNMSREDLSNTIQSLKDKLKLAETKRDELGDFEECLDEELSNFDDVIEKHSESTRAYNEYVTYKQKLDSIKKLDSEYKELTRHIENLKQKKVNELKKLKINNVRIEEDDLFYKNIDSSNLSGMQKMMLAIEIAISQNPNLRAILVEANELDEENLKNLDERAKDCDLQVIATYVKNENKKTVDGEFYIENGEIQDENDEFEIEF